MFRSLPLLAISLATGLITAGEAKAQSYQTVYSDGFEEYSLGSFDSNAGQFGTGTARHAEYGFEGSAGYDTHRGVGAWSSPNNGWVNASAGWNSIFTTKPIVLSTDDCRASVWLQASPNLQNLYTRSLTATRER